MTAQSCGSDDKAVFVEGGRIRYACTKAKLEEAYELDDEAAEALGVVTLPSVDRFTRLRRLSGGRKKRKCGVLREIKAPTKEPGWEVLFEECIDEKGQYQPIDGVFITDTKGCYWFEYADCKYGFGYRVSARADFTSNQVHDHQSETELGETVIFEHRGEECPFGMSTCAPVIPDCADTDTGEPACGPIGSCCGVKLGEDSPVEGEGGAGREGEVPDGALPIIGEDVSVNVGEADDAEDAAVKVDEADSEGADDAAVKVDDEEA